MMGFGHGKTQVEDHCDHAELVAYFKDLAFPEVCRTQQNLQAVLAQRRNVLAMPALQQLIRCACCSCQLQHNMHFIGRR